MNRTMDSRGARRPPSKLKSIHALLYIGITALAVASSCSQLSRKKSGGERAFRQPPTMSAQEDFKITNYTVAQEANFSSTEQMCNVRGLGDDRCYDKRFLCSGWGVAMQGTGLAENGRYIKYAGCSTCRWNDNHTMLLDCEDNATFAYVSGVMGASQRVLQPNYSIAVDPDVISLGSYVWIDELCQWFRADDTGGIIEGHHIDVYTGTNDPGYSTTSDIFVTASAHAASDPGPYPGGGCSQ